jgi:protein-S-isoprenylcysteine O-methyltransferase Ste14
MAPRPHGVHPLELRVPPPLVALVVAALMAWLSLHSPPMGLPSAWRWGLVLLLVAVGGSFDVAGLLAFRRQRTTVNPLRPEKASALVSSGVYRITRNPMYGGLAFLLLAWGLWLDAWLALIGPLVFIVYITRFQIRPEERVLAERFGPDFTDYTRRVRRWL